MGVRKIIVADRQSDEPVLLETDARAIIFLQSGIAGKGSDRSVLIAFMLGGLCELLGADKWVRILPASIGKNGFQAKSAVTHGGFSDMQFGDMLASVAVADPSADALETFFQSKRIGCEGHLTCRLEDYDLHPSWLASPSGVLAANAGAGTFIRNISPADGAGSSCTITLYRIPGSLPFTERERHIAHLLLSEVGWLHECVWTSLWYPAGVAAPRKSLLQVISLMLAGLSRQEVSDKLGITMNTVNSYLKEIYRHYGVHSQLELIRVVSQGKADG